MNMRPDLVTREAVDVALAAIQEYAHNPSERAKMEIALAAALPVLLGDPVLFQSRDRFMEFSWAPWITFENEQDRNSDFIRMSKADGWQAEKRDLYTLPTQDTPNERIA